MLTTFQRLMDMAKVTRRGTVTYDNRPQGELIRQLMAEVEVLRRRVREMEHSTPEGLRRGERSDPQEPRRGDYKENAQ